MVGEHPVTTLAKARDLAERLRVRIADGADPATERKRARTNGRSSPVRTVATAVEHFIVKNQEGQALKTWGETQRVLRRYVAGRIGDRQLRSITRGMVMQLLDDVRGENGSRARRGNARSYRASSAAASVRAGCPSETHAIRCVRVDAVPRNQLVHRPMVHQ
jgi:Arm DNA-binding domain